MAVQNPTTNYGFVLPVPGSDTGSWGPKLRAIFGEVMDSIDTVANDLEQKFSTLDADNLITGTVPDGRIAGPYTNIQDLTCSGTIQAAGAQLGNQFIVDQGNSSFSSPGTYNNRDPGDNTFIYAVIGSNDIEITGFTGGVGGRVIVIQNGGSGTLTLRDDDTRSSVANRLRMAASLDVTLERHDMARFIYDGITTRWRWVPSSV